MTDTHTNEKKRALCNQLFHITHEIRYNIKSLTAFFSYFKISTEEIPSAYTYIVFCNAHAKAYSRQNIETLPHRHHKF